MKSLAMNNFWEIFLADLELHKLIFNMTVNVACKELVFMLVHVVDCDQNIEKKLFLVFIYFFLKD